MTISGRTIARNASLLMVSQLVTWGLSFLLTIFMPRRLGPVGIGQLELGNALWAIVAVIATIGTDTLITKEVARSRAGLNELFGTTLVLRAFIFALSALGMFVYVRLADYPPATVQVIWIIGLSFFIGQPVGIYDSALKGMERMEYTSLAAVVFIALLTFPRIGLLLLGYGVIPIALVGIFANLGNLAVLAYFSNKVFPFRPRVNWGLIGVVLKASVPYFMVAIGIALYHQVDTVIISLLVNEETIGWYGVADHLFGTLLFIPNVFMTALFPALSRSYSDSQTAAQKLAQKSMNLLLLLAVPIGLGIMVIADQLVVLLFGASFTKSGPVLAIRGVILILTYINMLIGFLLISMDRQKAWAWVMIAATLATVILDLFLIPWAVKTFANGAIGGAISYAFTETGMIVFGLALLPRRTFTRENVRVLVRLLASGVVMAAVAWMTRGKFIAIPIVTGAATYLAMILLLRALPREDWNFLFETMRSILQRFRKKASTGTAGVR